MTLKIKSRCPRCGGKLEFTNVLAARQSAPTRPWLGPRNWAPPAVEPCPDQGLTCTDCRATFALCPTQGHRAATGPLRCHCGAWFEDATDVPCHCVGRAEALRWVETAAPPGAAPAATSRGVARSEGLV